MKAIIREVRVYEVDFDDAEVAALGIDPEFDEWQTWTPTGAIFDSQSPYWTALGKINDASDNTYPHFTQTFALPEGIDPSEAKDYALARHRDERALYSPEYLARLGVTGGTGR